MAFTPGWSFDYAMQAQGGLLATGRYASVGAPTKPPRKAVSLSHLRLNYLEQGAPGTCYACSTASLFAITAKSLGYEAFAASRRLIAWATKAIEDGANPADGASPTDSIRVMAEGGVGVAHEHLCPYTEDRNVLAQRPPQSVFDDAKQSHLRVPIAVKNSDQIVSLIDGGSSGHGLPVANGFQAPVELQSHGTTFVKTIGGILGGHSELITGFSLPGVFDEHAWFELENSWGLIYRPLPPSLAKLVDGYEPVTPTRTSSCWVRKDVYLQLCQSGCEHVSATDIGGLTRGGLVAGPGFHSVLPV